MVKKKTAKAPKPTKTEKPQEPSKVQKFSCKQRGCKFQAKEPPEFCPVCNHPFFGEAQ